MNARRKRDREISIVNKVLDNGNLSHYTHRLACYTVGVIYDGSTFFLSDMQGRKWNRASEICTRRMWNV